MDERNCRVVYSSVCKEAYGAYAISWSHSRVHMIPSLHTDACVSQLQALGLARGDTVLVRAATSAIGTVSGENNRPDFLTDAILETIGPEGLLLGLSFSKSDWIFRFPKKEPYDTGEPAVTGGLVAAMLRRPHAYRSDHPTNSFVAMGEGASAFLADHDAEAACFAPIRKLIARRGKMMLIGCEQTSPGFSTVHLVQHDLGLDTRTWMGLILGRRYLAKDGSVRWYRKKDVPGCSMGFGKFYEPYRAEGILREGKVGEANGLLIDAAAAYDVEHGIVSRDPTAALCDRDCCMTCRLGWFYKPIEARRFLGARFRGERCS